MMFVVQGLLTRLFGSAAKNRKNINFCFSNAELQARVRIQLDGQRKELKAIDKGFSVPNTGMWEEVEPGYPHCGFHSRIAAIPYQMSNNSKSSVVKPLIGCSQFFADLFGSCDFSEGYALLAGIGYSSVG